MFRFIDGSEIKYLFTVKYSLFSVLVYKVTEKHTFLDNKGVEESYYFLCNEGCMIDRDKWDMLPPDMYAFKSVRNYLEWYINSSTHKSCSITQFLPLTVNVEEFLTKLHDSLLSFYNDKSKGES